MKSSLVKHVQLVVKRFSQVVFVVLLALLLLSLLGTISSNHIDNIKIRDSLAHNLGVSISEKRIIEISRIIAGFKASKPGLQVCLKIDKNTQIGSFQCPETSFETYQLPLSEHKYRLGTIIPFDYRYSYWFGAFALLMAVFLLGLRFVVNSFCEKITHDIGILSNPSSLGETFFSETDNARAKLVDWAEIDKIRYEVYLGQQFSQKATQVAHDIRSPLSALNVAVTKLTPDNNEVENLIKKVLQRLNFLADSLLKENSQVVRAVNKQPLTEVAKVLRQIQQEKFLEYSDLPTLLIECDTSKIIGGYAPIDEHELQVIGSNIVNNARDACRNQGRILITADMSPTNIFINICDDGCGIPETIIDELGKRGLSAGKADGNGLGWYHSQKLLNNVGGKIEVASTSTNGTTIKITLPRAFKYSS